MEKMILAFGKIVTKHKEFHNVRGPVDPKAPDIVELAADIKRNELISPLTVWLTDGEYVLIAGYRRHAALGLNKAETVPVLVYEGDLRGATIINLVENTSRKNLTTYQLAVRCREMAEKPLSMSHSEIAKALSSSGEEWSKSYVGNLIRLTTALHPDIIKDWAAGDSTPSGRMATINKLQMVEKHDKTTQLSIWRYDILGLPRPGADGETGGGEGSGDGGNGAETAATPPKKGMKREAVLSLIAAVEKSKKSDAWKDAAVTVLKLAAGERKTLDGIWPVKKEEPAKEATAGK